MIRNIELLNYIKENISLVRTMVIKIEDLALLDNNKMLTSLGLNSGDDKTKWRYYLNLNGEYHITDEMMYVKSLDNDEEIEFTKENLKDHLATKKAYRLGGYYYTRLAEKYSHQVDLIKGIINPIPTSESIPAKNGTILRYNTDYVNDNEILLISKVQDVINKFIYQTFNTEYKHTENLMMSFLVGRLHNAVLKEIITYRLENAFTRQAHPFYIWSHLQSCGISPIYKKVLNKEQTFWLFRNIEYILRNQGKDFTFKLLIDNLLTKRDIPLLKYDLVHSTETMKEDLFPKPLYQVRRLNLVDSKGYMDELTTLPIAMTKEVPDAIDNELTYEMYLSKTENDGRDSYTSNYPIKLLESSMVDTSLRKPETIFHVINAELIYLAKNDIYNINLDIVEPLSGNHFRFNVKEAITLWYGLLDKLNGCTSGKLGEIFYNKALKITPPTLNQLMDLSGPPFLTEAWCEDLLKTHIPQSRIISPIAFFNNAKAISDLKWTHEKMYSMFPSIGYYSRRKNACSTMYESGWVKLTDFKTLDELLDKKGISLKDYNDSDLENLIFELWNKMTGWSAAGYATLGSIQQGLINLMKYLSSYSVQYIQNISVADGWYEGGLDLLTENPVNLGTDGEKPELDAGGDNFRVPIDIHVVTQNEVDKSIIGIIEENGFVLEGEVVGTGSIKQTPLLYPVEIEDDEPTGGILPMNGCLDQRCVPFTGKLPFDIEDFIPKGSTLNNQHKTNSMLIDKLTGIRKIGGWEVFGLNIVNNGLDNLFVSKEFNFQKLNHFVLTTLGSEDNKIDYYFGPARCEAGKYVLKLEVIVKNEKTNEVVNVRFDYPIEITESTHSVTFDIPESVNIGEEFVITPKFTGLEIGNEYEFIDVIDDPSNTYLYLEPTLNDYLTIRQENGVIYGKFIKLGWPKTLPLYLQSKLKYKPSSVTDPYKDIYLHSIGNIPSDRYYDPIDDEDFIPTYQGYNQRREGSTASFGLIGDEFKVIASKKGWSPVKLEIKKDENGNYPKRVLLDYNGFKDATKPIYEKSDNVTIDGKEYCKFLTYFSYDELDDKEGQEQTLTMVLTLQNKNGLTIEKEFEYKFFMVSIISFKIDNDTLPKELPIGIDTISEIKYRTYSSNDKHVFNGLISKDSYDDLTMNFTPIFKDGVLGDLNVNPKSLWDKDHEYLISVKGRNENYHGLAFNYISLDTINLSKELVHEVKDVSISDFDIKPDIIYSESQPSS